MRGVVFSSVERCGRFHIGHFRKMWAKGWGAWSVLAEKKAGIAYLLLYMCPV